MALAYIDEFDPDCTADREGLLLWGDECDDPIDPSDCI